MELGLYTFADVGTDPVTGRRIGPSSGCAIWSRRSSLADAGRASRSSASASTTGPTTPPRRRRWRWPAAATQTKRIRLTSAVSVLSSDDPVRVFQQFATLDALSAGRAEIMVGRGSFIESFPLFGYDLDDYDALFEREAGAADAAERGRAGQLAGQRAHPARSTAAASIRARSRRGCRSGSRSAARRNRWCARARSSLPLALAIIGGEPARFAPLFDLYRRAAAQARA